MALLLVKVGSALGVASLIQAPVLTSAFESGIEQNNFKTPKVPSPENEGEDPQTEYRVWASPLDEAALREVSARGLDIPTSPSTLVEALQHIAQSQSFRLGTTALSDKSMLLTARLGPGIDGTELQQASSRFFTGSGEASQLAETPNGNRPGSSIVQSGEVNQTLSAPDRDDMNAIIQSTAYSLAGNGQSAINLVVSINMNTLDTRGR